MLLSLIACGQSSDIGGNDAPGDAGIDADPVDAVMPAVPPEVDGRLVINEVMTVNVLTVLDDDDVGHDWIELYNPNDEDISLHGYGITDVLADPNKQILSEDVVVPAHGHLLLWADDRPALGGAHLGFKLKRESGEIGLSRPDGTWIDRIDYGAQAVDFSVAREPDGSDHWVIEWHPSPGAANPAGAGQEMGLEDAGAPPEAVPGAGDISEQILGYDVLLEIALEIPETSANALRVAPFTYVPGHIVYAGRTYGPVGVRLKGVGSFEPFDAKPSFRINVDEFVDGAKFFGLDDMTLNNMHGDPSMLRERLAYWVMRAAGVPASRCNHAFLHVNGEVYGLYANVETLGKEMMARWFDDAAGTLYEGTEVDFVASDIPDFEHEYGPDDRTHLYGVADAMLLPTASNAIAAAGEHADMAAFRRFWATASVIGQFDAWPYRVPGDDFYVFVDPTSGRLQFSPWGTDESFLSGDHSVTSVNAGLAVTCRGVPSCEQAWIDDVWDVLALTEQMNLADERTQVAAQIHDWVILDTNKSYTNEAVWAQQNDVYWFINGRRGDLEGMLP